MSIYKKLITSVLIVLMLFSVAACYGKQSLVDERLLSHNRNIDEKTRLSLNDGVQIMNISEEKCGITVIIEQTLAVKNGMGIAGKIVVPGDLYKNIVDADTGLFSEHNLKIYDKDFDIFGSWSRIWTEYENIGENTVSFAVAFTAENATFDKGETITLEFTKLNGQFSEYDEILPLTISWELENVLSDLTYERPERRDFQ